jgi:hypothetical protein
MKRTVPLLIASITGLVLVVASFVPFAESWGETAMIWFDILASIAFVIGAGNILKVCLKKISDRRAGWGYALVTLIAFLITLSVGLFKIGVHPSEQFATKPWSGDYVSNGSAFWWAYQYVYLPLAATMFSLLAFYIASASFRAFRAKNTEALILLTTAFIVLLGQASFGDSITAFLPALPYGLDQDLQFSSITSMIMNVFNLAGNRAIMLGIALGVVSLSLKILLGVDRSYLGSD